MSVGETFSTSPAASARPSWRRPLWLVTLALLAGWVVAARWHTRDEPFERDIGSHAVIAHEMLAGRALYSDLWDSKPPAIWIAYGAGELIFGYGPGQVLGLGLLAALATIAGCSAAGVALGSPPTGLWAAAFWAVACSDLWLWANQPNIEAFIDPLLVWALALMLGARPGSDDRWRFATVGVLLATATLFKHVVAPVAVLLACAHVALPPGGARDRRRAVVQAAFLLGVPVVAWALVLGWFAASGRGAVFYETIFEYGRFYTESRGGSLVGNLLDAFGAKGLFGEIPRKAFRHVWPLAAIGAVGVARGVYGRVHRPVLLVAAALLGAQVAIGIPGRFYPHYYQLLLPGLVLAAALAAELPAAASTGRARWVGRGVAGLALVALGGLQLPSFALTPDEWSTRKYGGQFVISKRTGLWLGGLLEKDERLYVWGINPELYFWSRKSPPTGIVWSHDALEGPFAEAFAQRIVDDLAADPPELIVVNKHQLAAPRNHPVVLWSTPLYVGLPESRDNPLFGFMVRRGGRLAADLERRSRP